MSSCPNSPQLIKFSGVAAGEACTIVLRGATNQLLDEAERSLHDALSVLSQTVKEPRTVLGGGCAEMLMSKAVDEVAATTAGKKAVAVESFARALRQMPTILADNAGYDSSDLVAKLRAAHYEGKSTSGLGTSIILSLILLVMYSISVFLFLSSHLSPYAFISLINLLCI